MATVTKPIALDESLNTTELSSRNVADVLAQELSAVATAIGGISAPSAEDVSYDNSVSGLSATDVQNAIDELSSEKANSSSLATVATSGSYTDLSNKPTIPTVNNGQLDILQNGKNIGSFTANQAIGVVVPIITPTAETKTAVNSSEFKTENGGLLQKCLIDLVPVQSGSGDPSPDNIRPISGHTEVDLLRYGKNIFLTTATNGTTAGIIYTNNGDGSVSVSGTRNGASGKVIGRAYVNSGMGKVTVSGLSESTNIALSYYRLHDKDGTMLYSSLTFGTTDLADYPTVAYIEVTVKGTANGDVASGRITIQVEKGETATSWEYTAHLYQVSIGSTVYVGYVDLVSGVMISTHKGVTISDVSQLEGFATSAQYGAYATIANTSDCKVTDSTKVYGLASMCKYVPFNDRLTSASIDRCWSDTNNQKVYIRAMASSNISSVADLFARFTNAQIIYELATPLTIQLTPQQIETLSGQNNLSCPLEGQSLENNGVEYKQLFTFADVKSYVDKKIPDAPTTDGTYTLTAVVSGGVPTYSWT